MTPESDRARPSLRRRLLLLQLVVFGGLLLGSPATYLYMARSLDRDLDAHLRQLASALARAHPHAGVAPAAAPPPCRVVPEANARYAHPPRHILVVDGADRVRCSDGETAPLAPAAVARARATGAPVFATRRQPAEALRLIAWPFRDAAGEPLVLEVGGSHAAVEGAVRHGTLALVVINLLALVLLLAGSYVLARRTFGPLGRMVRQVEAIDEANLAARLPAEPVDHELGRLVLVLNRMLDRLQRAFEAQRRLSSDVSHEIRSPLTALRGQIEVALRKERAPAEYQQVLRESLEEVLRLHRLTEDLLSLAKADAGALAPAREQIALGELLGQTLARPRPEAEAKGVRLELYVGAEATVVGDPDLLGRLVENLLDNAIRHSAPGGEIQVLLRRAGAQATVSVRDAGEGIPAEHLPHVFERFYRVDRARSRDHGGAGLGLAIAQQIAVAHGGGIRVTSTPGEGAVFTVELPLAAP